MASQGLAIAESLVNPKEATDTHFEPPTAFSPPQIAEIEVEARRRLKTALRHARLSTLILSAEHFAIASLGHELVDITHLEVALRMDITDFKSPMNAAPAVDTPSGQERSREPIPPIIRSYPVRVKGADDQHFAPKDSPSSSIRCQSLRSILRAENRPPAWHRSRR